MRIISLAPEGRLPETFEDGAGAVPGEKKGGNLNLREV
jgi:hypothetical protein